MPFNTKTRAIPYAGLAALKLAAAITPEALGAQALRREFARKLVQMRGIPMKMAQVLSMSKDQGESRILSEALVEVSAASKEQVIARLSESAPGILEEIRTFSESGIAASLGQVHEVGLKDGRRCALKVKHAGIGSAMNMDTQLMEFLVSVFGQFKQGFSINAYQELLTKELRWELDYPFEIARQAKIWREFQDRPAIVVPKPYPLESGVNHLLMDWEPSMTVEAFSESASTGERWQASRNLAEFHLRTLFNLEMAHADPNPGNFGLRRGSAGVELVVYDFGSLAPLEPGLARGFTALLESAIGETDPYPILINMGFTPEPLSAIRPKLPALCRILLQPFLSDGGFKLRDWDRSSRVKQLLGSERWNLMIAAPVDLFFLMRAFHGLFHYLDRLGEFPDLKNLIQSLLQTRGMEPCPDRETSKGRSPDNPLNHPDEMRSKLRIAVRKSGTTTVSLTMPSDAVTRLDSVMEPELLQSIRANGIDIEVIAEKARAGGFRPMDLFTWNSGNKEVKIWLE